MGGNSLLASVLGPVDVRLSFLPASRRPPSIVDIMLGLGQRLLRGFRSSLRLRADIEVFIDGKPIKVDSTYTIYQACQKAGVIIPRFCFHERLAIAGSCRMCLVEVEKSPKPVASCSMPVMPGMKVNTQSVKTYNARGGVMEFLLANHPLDCPICDQGGECDLQDQSELYGYGQGRFMEYKRGVEDKEVGPLIDAIMTRCIHCTRCVRFAEEVMGTPVLGTTGRGRETEVGSYVQKLLTSELSGNLVDLCPVGALTNAPYAFTARPWELRTINTVDVMDSIAPAISVNTRGPEVMRVLPRIHEEVNEEWIHDRSRHAFDGLKRQRLSKPLIRNEQGEFQEVLWQDAMQAISREINKVSGEEICGMIGEHMDVEAIVAFRDLLYRLGCENIESKRFGINVQPDLRTNYLMNSRLPGVEEADVLLIVGANPKLESPVLNARVRKAVNNGLEVIVIGPNEHLTYNYHHAGTSVDTLEALVSGSHPLSSLLAKAKQPMVLVGAHTLQREDGAGILRLLDEINRKYKVIQPENHWNGFNVLHKDVGTVAALELGIGSSRKEGLKPKFVYLLGADNFRPEEIPEGAFVVYQGTHGDEGVYRANVILPGAAYTEKQATYVSTEGRVQMTRLATAAPGQARPDWEIIRALSEVMGQSLPYDDLHQMRLRIAELAPHLVKYDHVEESSFGDLMYVDPAAKTNKTLLTDYVDVSVIQNFYMVDAVSRASPTMAKCTAAFAPARNSNFVSKVPMR